MIRYEAEVPLEVADVLRHLAPDTKRSINQALRALEIDPNLGEPLHDDLEGYWKYRVRRFRIAYAIDRERRLVQVLAVGPRSRVYEDAAERLRERRRAQQ